MLGFHRRTRSLIPVKDLAKYDKLPTQEEDIDACPVTADSSDDVFSRGTRDSRRRQLILIYAIFFAEAIMASSLRPQLRMLIDSDDFCGNLSTSYLRSILECAYAFGGTAGILSGYLSDRLGRRRVTLFGLWGMLLCCLSMGFATDLASCTISRFFAGLTGSSVIVTTLTMIGDLSDNMSERARNVSRLPIVALCGSIGPLVEGLVTDSMDSNGTLFGKYPALSTQITCGSIIFVVAVTASVMLQDTLNLQSHNSPESLGVDCEKAAFLANTEANESSLSLASSQPEPIAINQFLQAPSFVVLVSSFSLLSLHASIFDVLLPHLGHSSIHQGGMGIPCSWLGFTVLGVRGLAGIAILYALPRAVERVGVLKLYRYTSLSFPTIYCATPLLATAAAYSIGFAGIVSAFCLLVKHALAGGASVLVSLLVLNTPPDAFSAGTVVGMMQVANLFRALAVAVSGASFYFSDDLSVTTTNLALWTCLTLLGAVGAALAYFVKERPSVDRDYPSEVLHWETCFDAAEGIMDA